jgi:signal transduction histidine kinase
MQPEDFSAESRLQFRILPVYAKFLLENRLGALVDESLRMTRGVDFPLLKHFSFMSAEQMREASLKSTADFLRSVIDNKLYEYTQQSIDRWVNNLLPIITRDQILAEDITLGNYIRKVAYSRFIPDFTADVREAMAITEELDRFVQYSEFVSIQTFLKIQQENINDINTRLLHKQAQLLEAQEIARIGNFEWDLTGAGRSSFSFQLYQIFEMEESSNLSEFLNYVHPDDRPKVMTSIDQALIGKSDYDCEYRYNRNGKEKIVWSRGIVEFVDGNPSLMKGTVMDVTDRYQMLMRLRETSEKLESTNISLELKNKELEKSNKELSSFNYIASHDLQEPLRKIRTFSDRILETEVNKLSATGQDFFRRIIHSSARMQKLIDDLLSFSRTNTFIESAEPVDLNRIVADIPNHYFEAVQDKRIFFDISPLPVIRGVPYLIRQLFENLIGNSVKYAKQNTPLKIRISVTDVEGRDFVSRGADANLSYFRIRIEDNGIGFDPRHADRIFEIFQRLHGKNEYPGTGIGLAICQRIVENHHGFIMATGKVNEGATFDVFFPI